jgi:hypothetical protein
MLTSISPLKAGANIQLIHHEQQEIIVHLSVHVYTGIKLQIQLSGIFRKDNLSPMLEFGAVDRLVVYLLQSVR